MQDLMESRKKVDYLLGAYRRHIEEGEGEHDRNTGDFSVRLTTKRR